MSHSYNFFETKRDYENKVMTISFNRSPVNALTKECYIELLDILTEISHDEEICVAVLRSSNRLFSAGADINNLKNDNPQQAAIRREHFRRCVETLYKFPVPLVCAVNGAAVGAGAILAACGDIIVAADDAFFSLPEINVGAIGGAKSLSRFLPAQKIRAMVLTGNAVSADEAYRLGGVESIVDVTDLEEKAMEYARGIADKGYLAARKWKQALIVTESVGTLEGLYIEQTLGQELSVLSK